MMLVVRSYFLNVLMLCALLAQGVVPLGFMPNLDSANNVTITICTGQGYQDISVPSDGEQHLPSMHDECPYAVSALPYVVSEAQHYFLFFSEYINQINVHDQKTSDILYSYVARAPPQFV